MKTAVQLAALVVLLLLSVLQIVYTGWVITKLWLWFMVPLGVPAIGIAHAIGLGILISLIAGLHFLAREKDAEIKGTNEKMAYRLIGSAVVTSFAWAFGALAASLM